MKVVTAIAFTLSVILNIILLFHGWILRMECEYHLETNQELSTELEIQNQEITRLGKELKNIKEKKITAANNGEHAGPR